MQPVERRTKTRVHILTLLKDGAAFTTGRIAAALSGVISYPAVANCIGGMVEAELLENLEDKPYSKGKYRITKRGVLLLKGETIPRIGHRSELHDHQEDEPAPTPATTDVEVMSEYDADLFDQVSIRYDEIIADLLARIEALEELATKPAQAPEPVLLMAPAPKERKPSVFLGGAKPSQGFMIAKEFRDQFDVRCASSDDLNKWRSMAKNCDYVLAMQPFISHKHTETLQSAGKDIVYVHSMTDIRDTLTKIYVEGK